MKTKTRLLIFTGAGASADSGIPTFRGNTASLWAGALGGAALLIFGQPFGYRYIPRITAFVIEHFFRRPVMRASPNACHQWIARRAAEDAWARIITQNVDGLHQRAGTPSDQIAEVHGSVWRTICAACGTPLAHETPHNGTPAPMPVSCRFCGGVPRPAVTLFNERLPYDEMERAAAFVAEFGDATDQTIVLIVGTSGAVPTSNCFINECHARNHRVIYVDPQPAERMLRHCNDVLCETAATAFSLLLNS